MSDFFDEVLQDLRPARAAYCRCELGKPWGLDLPYQPGVRFHFVAAGECWLILAGGKPVHLATGDLALVLHGAGHVIADPPEASAHPVDEVEDRSQVGEATYRLRAGGAGQRALIFCCAVEFDALAARSLIGAMPDLLLIARTRTRDGALISTLDQMTAEVAAPRIGSATMMARLADIVIVRALRLWMEDNANSPTSWFAAMRDPQIGLSLAAMHRSPGESWTVEALARTAGLSRSAFSERFVPLLGMSPGRYVAQWRMQLAAGLLREGRQTMAEIAAKLGYESDASFSRTFKRIMGESPSAVRRKARMGGS